MKKRGSSKGKGRAAGNIFQLEKYPHSVYQDMDVQLQQASKAGPSLFEAIQSLPPELKEMIFKEYVTLKIKEGKRMGWGEINREIDDAFFCHKRQQITRISTCRKCANCERNGMCMACLKLGEKHHIDPLLLNSSDCEDFIRYL